MFPVAFAALAVWRRVGRTSERGSYWLLTLGCALGAWIFLYGSFQVTTLGLSWPDEPAGTFGIGQQAGEVARAVDKVEPFGLLERPWLVHRAYMSAFASVDIYDPPAQLLLNLSVLLAGFILPALAVCCLMAMGGGSASVDPR
jgi:hypothetical protein